MLVGSGWAASDPQVHNLSQPAGPGGSGLACVLLAAGMGTRMRSALPKVLHPLCGRPMGVYALETVHRLAPDQLVVVTGHRADQVEAQLGQWASRLRLGAVQFVRQEPQLGTGHAVAQAMKALLPAITEVLVTYADIPLLTDDTLWRLVQARRAGGHPCAILTARLEDPAGYGRIRRDAAGRVVGVVEERDASPDERRIREVNTGIYCFERRALARALGQLRPDNAQGEYYLTDVVGLLAPGPVAVELEDPAEVQGVNDRWQLAGVEAVLFERARRRLAAGGVRLVNPHEVLVHPWVEVETDGILYGPSMVWGERRLGPGCVIGPGSRVVDSVLEEGVMVEGAVLVGAHVGRGAQIGPGVWLASGARVAPGTRIGGQIRLA